MSKTRVAPLKDVSIPRLELCAALILSQLTKFIIDTVDVPIENMTCFSDSQVVLAWLRKPSSSLKEFVKNRINQIRDLLPEMTWKFVPTKFNPADLCSRGMSPVDIIQSDLWWHGPDVDQLMNVNVMELTDDNLEVDIEMKVPTVASSHTEVVDMSRVERFSTLDKLLRVATRCARWRRKNRDSFEQGATVEDVNHTMRGLVRYEQGRHLADTMERLRNGKPLQRRDQLLELNPFIDGHGMLRVGGRLENSDLNFDAKHPIIIPRQSNLAVLLITNEHLVNNHIGRQTVLSNLRQKYWITRASMLIKQVLRNCVRCFRFRPIAAKQLMGTLPSERVSPNSAFSHVGIDFAGPFMLRPIRKRGVNSFKAYVALFVCLSSKALHLEVVSDLTRDACLAAVSRFVSRRGRPAYIISDNGTNLVGSARYLDAAAKVLKSSEFNRDMSSALAFKQIDWKFIPARSPEFGGLWEAQVKSAKACLLKCAKGSLMVLEEFVTLLCQIESTLNMRPLGYVDSGTEDKSILTPGHLAIGRHILGLPELNLNDPKMSLNTRWVYVQNRFNDFWAQWSRDYLTTLQGRKIDRVKDSNVQIGAVGILKEDCIPPLGWRLCRVERVYPAADGLVRVIDVRVGERTLKRSIKSFSPLPNVSSLNEATGGGCSDLFESMDGRGR